MLQKDVPNWRWLIADFELLSHNSTYTADCHNSVHASAFFESRARAKRSIPTFTIS
jgi:hypothetical protein